MKILLALCLPLLLVSCSLTKRAVSTFSGTRDSSHVKTDITSKEKQTDSAGIHRIDSGRVAKAESTNKATSKTVTTEDIAIEFADDTDSSAAAAGRIDSARPGKTSVVISRDKNGTTTIDPGGRKIKSIHSSNTGTQEKNDKSSNHSSDSSYGKNFDTTHVVTSGKISNAKTDNTHVVASTTARNINVSRWSFPWYAYLILVVAVIIFVRYRLWRRSRLVSAGGMPKFYDPPTPPDRLHEP
jgi:hypothetical protein